MFTHANYIGLKGNDKNLMDLFIHPYSNHGYRGNNGSNGRKMMALGV